MDIHLIIKRQITEVSRREEILEKWKAELEKSTSILTGIPEGEKKLTEKNAKKDHKISS